MTDHEQGVLARVEEKIDQIVERVERMENRVNRIETDREVDARVASALLADRQRSRSTWSGIAKIAGDWTLRIIGLAFVALQVLGAPIP